MEGDLKTLISIFISESLEYNQDAENMDTIALLVRYMTENLKENYDLIKNKQPFKIYFGIRPEDIHHHVDNNKDYQKSKDYILNINFSELLGNEFYVHLDFANKDLIAKIPAGGRNFLTGEQFKVHFDLDKVHLFDFVKEENIE